jgi:RNA polymerase sigma factor (sigma-70 family)
MTAMNVMNYPQSGSCDDDLRLFARSGDAEAFARLTQRYINVVYTFCCRQLADPHLAEDATQAVFILLAQKAKSLRPGVILSGWLFDASRYCCQNARRAVARRARHEMEAANLRPETVENINSLEQEELGQALHQALARLRRSDRQMLLMRFFDQLSHREMAGRMQITEEAAKQRLARSMHKLREVMRVHGAAAGLLAMLPDWLETKAISTAPTSLASTSINVALGGGASTSAVLIAKAASSAMFWFKLQIAFTLIAGMAILGGGAVLVGPAAQSSPVATTPAASQPATSPVALQDRSAPLETIREAGRRLESLDIDGLKQAVLIPDNDEGALTLAGARVDMTQIRITNAIRAALGRDLPGFRLSEPTSAQLISAALEQTRPEDVQIDGDHATVRLRFSPERAANPVVMSLQGAPVHMVRVEGKWKIDLLASATYVTFDSAGRMHRAKPKDLIKFYDLISNTADGLVNDFMSGKLTDPADFVPQFQKRLAEGQVRENIDYIHGATLVPKSMDAQLLP